MVSRYKQFNTYRVRCRDCRVVFDKKDCWGKRCKPCMKIYVDKKKKENEQEMSK